MADGRQHCPPSLEKGAKGVRLASEGSDRGLPGELVGQHSNRCMQVAWPDARGQPVPGAQHTGSFVGTPRTLCAVIARYADDPTLPCGWALL